jgi:hypothetical protein
LTLNELLKNANIPFAFGGAIALGFCIDQPRATADLDINIFLAIRDIDKLLSILPAQIKVSRENRNALKRDGQARLFWGDTAIDFFLNTHEFHTAVSKRIYEVNFAGGKIPVLSCEDLALFKAFFARTRDWADIEEMVRSHSIDPARVYAELKSLLGADHENIKAFSNICQKAMKQ